MTQECKSGVGGILLCCIFLSCVLLLDDAFFFLSGIRPLFIPLSLSFSMIRSTISTTKHETNSGPVADAAVLGFRPFQLETKRVFHEVTYVCSHI
jgi:hypothetical protein